MIWEQRRIAVYFDLELTIELMGAAMMGLAPVVAIVLLSLVVARVVYLIKGEFWRNFGVAVAFGSVGTGLGLFTGQSGVEVAKLTLPIILTAIVGYLAWTLKSDPPLTKADQPPPMSAVKMMFMAAPIEKKGETKGESPPEKLDAGRVVLACVILMWGMIGGLYWGEALQAHQTRTLLVAAQAREDSVRGLTNDAAKDTAEAASRAARVLSWMEHVLAPLAVKAADATAPASP